MDLRELLCDRQEGRKKAKIRKSKEKERENDYGFDCYNLLTKAIKSQHPKS